MAAGGSAAAVVDWAKLQREGYGFVRDEDAQDDGMCRARGVWNGMHAVISRGVIKGSVVNGLLNRVGRCRGQVEAVLSSSPRAASAQMEQANGERTPV
jgi:hypothetical protein